MMIIQYATDFALSNYYGQLIFASVLGCACFITFQLVAGARSRPIAGQPHTYSIEYCTKCRANWLLARPVVLNLLAPLIVAISGRALQLCAVFGNSLWQSDWRCHAGAVIGCYPCNTTAEWCTVTDVCADVCKTDVSTAQAGSPCAAGWCSNHTCADCLLRQNSSLPPVDTEHSITEGGLLMSGGMFSFFWWMQLWHTFVPLGLTVALAALFLLYECTCCECQRVQECSDLITSGSLQAWRHAGLEGCMKPAAAAGTGNSSTTATARGGMVCVPTSMLYPRITEA